MQVEIIGQVHHETDAAILFSDDGENKVWIPKSQIEELDYSTGDEGVHLIEIMIPEWLALEKGLI